MCQTMMTQHDQERDRGINADLTAEMRGRASVSYPDYGPGYYGPPPQSHPSGTTILVLGILSLVVCTFIGPFAWSMGTKALREIDASGYVYENRGHVQAGRICGIISSIMLMVTLGFVALGLSVALIGGAFSSTGSY
ncbi:DUF4190 domain-containing protein [Nonomuraea sp. KM90]|uniref:DUF4190 domain-containing protein n=1 Tax=Nonomuraea sp. KM90 TaxID=3457428 RepID=UPI003FCD484D